MNTYDELPYDSLCIPETNPGRLAVLAHLFGLDFPKPTECRLLELGCASGGNLIPMAADLPRSRFVGIDLAPAQIDAGNAVIAALGLDNVELRDAAAALADIDDGIDLEQWMDFLSNRRFRQSLLYRADGPADEGLSLERFAGCAFGTDLAAPQELEPGSDLR